MRNVGPEDVADRRCVHRHCCARVIVQELPKCLSRAPKCPIFTVIETVLLAELSVREVVKLIVAFTLTFVGNFRMPGWTSVLLLPLAVIVAPPMPICCTVTVTGTLSV